MGDFCYILSLYMSKEKDMKRSIPIVLLIVVILGSAVSLHRVSVPRYETKQVKNYILGYYPNGTRFERIDIHNISVLVGYDTKLEVDPYPVLIAILLCVMFLIGVKRR